MDSAPSDNDRPDGVTPITNEMAQLMLAVERERADAEAMRTEFADAPTTEAYDKVRELFAKNVVEAAETVVHLAKFAESDAIRGSYAKYIIDTYLGKGKISGDDAAGDFKKFIASLTSKEGTP